VDQAIKSMQLKSIRCSRIAGAGLAICSVALLIAVRTIADSALIAAEQPVRQTERKPNIVLVLADDLGYGDLGCYGQSWIKTPNLDRLAREGIRFLNHYAGSAVGPPSRCCLLTGKHTGHAPVRADGDTPLPEHEVTVAEVLKQAGYATALIGKWGIGYPNAPGTPNRQGFDYLYGFLDAWHAHNYYPDFLWRNEAKCAVRGNVVRVIGRGGVAIKRTQYSQDLLTAQALTYIEEHRDHPFFLLVAFPIPHANTEAGRHGLEVPNDMPYSDREWPQPQKNYAAMITRLDYSVGRLAELLVRLGIAERTLLLFTSDNGPHRDAGADPAFFGSAGPLRGHKGSLYEGGIRVPLIAWWPGTIKPGVVTSHASAFWDFLPTAAELAGVDPPQGVDGISYLPTLQDDSEHQRQHEFLYWELHGHETQQAVRFGDWKAVRRGDRSTELFDLKGDPAESRNLAPSHPDIVQQAESLMKSAHTPSPLFPLKSASAKR